MSTATHAMEHFTLCLSRNMLNHAICMQAHLKVAQLSAAVEELAIERAGGISEGGG